MNGIVAKLTLPSARRLVRGILILGCCVLSVGLIGAVHTRPFDAARPAKRVSTRAMVESREDSPLEGPAGPVFATIQLPTNQSLTSAAAVELLHNVKTAAEKMLSQPAAPSGASPKFAVRVMEVTAYCACKKCCGPRAQGITASGRPVTFNGGKFVAADKNLGFNTRLLIPGYADGKSVPVLDRGGAIKGDKLDVYFPSHQEARQWGRRFILVTVMN